ncbi:MAG TPA: myo-inosose-2 dehydratase [Candidatus Paenibacillus intestinavium]|nr:myo-inosose-2 dehydratase [Candidatus Paenibacillus intestinavium]
MTIRLGISAINWVNEDILSLGDHYTADEVLTEMSSLGFEGTEFCRKFPQDVTTLQQLLAKYNMVMSSQWNSVHFSDASRVEEELEKYKQKVDFLSAMGCKHVVTCESGNTFEDLTQNKVTIDELTDEQWSSLIDGLHRAGQYCNDKGMKLVYHFHGETVIEKPAQIDRLMSSTNPDLVHLLYDTGHAYYGGYDPLVLLKKHYDRIAYIHLKDIREAQLQELIASGLRFRTGVQNGVFTVPGEGCIDFAPIVRELLDRRYDGWIIIEAEQDPAIANPVIYAEKGRTYLKSLGLIKA